MSKIAFIGDSFSAYDQVGQFENQWSWKLAQQFPQHQYYNYANGGRGTLYYQYALLDAKMRGVDIVFVNRTYNHRVGFLINDYDFKFEAETINDNYQTLLLDGNRHVWHSPIVNKNWHDNSPILARSSKILNLSMAICKMIGTVLDYQSVSLTSRQYNDKWFNNIKDLYNFKHLIPLELMNITDDNAFKQMAVAHGVNNCEDDVKMFKAGLTVSLTDQHLSPYGNSWVLENYILTPDTIKILE